VVPDDRRGAEGRRRHVRRHGSGGRKEGDRIGLDARHRVLLVPVDRSRWRFGRELHRPPELPLRTTAPNRRFPDRHPCGIPMFWTATRSRLRDRLRDWNRTGERRESRPARPHAFRTSIGVLRRSASASSDPLRGAFGTLVASGILPLDLVFATAPSTKSGAIFGKLRRIGEPIPNDRPRGVSGVDIDAISVCPPSERAGRTGCSPSVEKLPDATADASVTSVS